MYNLVTASPVSQLYWCNYNPHFHLNNQNVLCIVWCHTCDPVWENMACVHKPHLFILSCIMVLLICTWYCPLLAAQMVKFYCSAIFKQKVIKNLKSEKWSNFMCTKAHMWSHICNDVTWQILGKFLQSAYYVTWSAKIGIMSQSSIKYIII